MLNILKKKNIKILPPPKKKFFSYNFEVKRKYKNRYKYFAKYLYPINVKTTELIGPKFVVATHMSPELVKDYIFENAKSKKKNMRKWRHEPQRSASKIVTRKGALIALWG